MVPPGSITMTQTRGTTATPNMMTATWIITLATPMRARQRRMM
jgi:hypothetical protein|tara:strand:+ start:6047 stop:6175 length:129 start_codon:yes stop_codon:yes gene_type:complete